MCYVTYHQGIKKGQRVAACDLLLALFLSPVLTAYTSEECIAALPVSVFGIHRVVYL